MLARYGRNLHCLSGKEVEFLSSCTVAVIGCGGLGGYLIEYLGRLGIGEIIAADGDSFDESNLNRQLLCEPSCLGQGKAEAARRRMASVNPELRFTALPVRIGTENGAGLLEGSDLIMDAVDSIPARFALEEIAERMGIPLVHGAVAGWYGQVASIYPGDRTMEEIYAGSLGGRSQGIEDRLGNLSFGPAIVAGLAFHFIETVKCIYRTNINGSNLLISGKNQHYYIHKPFKCRNILHSYHHFFHTFF